MLARALLIALSCAYTSALTPLSAVGDDNDCALYLAGPGRTSAYDYSLNLLRGNFGYEGQHTCITYDAVNQAYLEARKRILVSQPKGDWKPEDFASVGELILDISINLARTYSLTYEEIEKGLPLIDTSRTLIREVCPPVFSHVECRAGKYRRFDGLCNNLQNPTWGSTNAPFQRLIGPLFADGINAPRIAHTGRDLPLSRVVSRTMHPDEGFHDHAGTVMVIAWGQFMDHDYTLTGTPLDPVNRNDPEECCKRPPHLKHPYCNEIRVPDDDYFYRLFGVKCIDFVRGFPSPRPGCRLGSRVPYNTLTGVLDGNTIYGVTEKFSRKLRTGYGGLLRMNPVFKEYGLKDLLPLKLDIPDEGCTRPNKNMYCFEAGEIRVNEQLVLAVMHTLMAREHNRVAEGLAAVNPHWDDETLFQEARRINIAEIQHITYNEFLPILLGKDVMEKFGLVLEKEGYWDGYDPKVNPDVIASFAAAAYRFGHSLLPTAVERWSKAHKFIASKRLSDLIRRPYDLYRAGVHDEYVMGLMNQVAQAMDDSITQEVTNHLFKKVGARFGMDLVSFNMQRGREFGLPGYMEFRKFCGLSGANTFQDLFGSMPNETVRKYETIFEHPIDVDLWSGGVSERPLPGSMLGPTFACIIATQFSYSRRGDRFWYELPNQPSSFTPEQLKEVRKSRLARVICDNTDIIDTVQLYPMVLPDHELNPRVPCRSGIIPSMDFSKWAEPAPFQGAAKQFVTEALIPSKNETEICDDQINVVTESSTLATEENCEQHNVTIETNQDCECNDTADITTSQQLNAELVTEPTPSNNDSSENSAKNDTSKLINDCVDNAQVVTDNCLDNLTVLNEINDGDTVLKYVYKKKDKVNILEKTKGHKKNSLKRRKRSYATEDQHRRRAKNAPLIVNYETSYVPKNREAFHKDTPNIIRGTNLADFNIETLHDKKAQTNKNSKEIDGNTKPQSYHESEESNEREEFKNNKRKARPFRINEDSNESGESYKTNKQDYLRNNKPTYSKSNLDSKESNENEKSSYVNSKENIEGDEKQSYVKNDKSKPSEESNEQKDKINEKYKDESNNRGNKTIQDVDIGDFSYERIQVNDKGEVESAKDTHTHSNIEPKLIEKQQSLSLESSLVSEPVSEDLKKDKKETVSINDGEIKPVVEINNESIELIEENNKSEEQKANLNNEDTSLETVLGVKETDNKEQNEKIVTQKDEKGDVKQQFERIPLNYNHEQKEEEQKDKDTSSETLMNTSEAVKDEGLQSDEDKNDGTLDTVKPKEERYDEHLKYKFDDLTIKLPEIKLPDDILSYAYEDPEDEKDNKKENQKQNDDDEEEENDEKQTSEQKKSDDNGHFGYYGFYGNADEDKQNYKKKESKDDDDDNDDDEEEDDNEEDEQEDENEDAGDVDLYEKFVRERFGKKGSFQERSEKLQQARQVPESPKLFDAIQKVLKKTEKTHKEAEKSGDPNAAYMWTLEYGENI